MIILKSQTVFSPNVIAEFVNINGIKREDISTIVAVGDDTQRSYTIYYYGDDTVEEKTKSLFGWS
jgi:hypothetical protein